MIQTLPEGYDTPIGNGGMALSGGQRQRIALARSLYKDPALIVMDEPNASLDHEGEAALMAAVQAMKDRGQTVVMVTHKPSILQVVDTILILKAGAVETIGPRDAVLSQLTKPNPPAQSSHASHVSA